MRAHITPFDMARMPQLHFGAGRFSRIGTLLSARGYRHVAVVTGGDSLNRSGNWQRLEADLGASGISLRRYSVKGEPGPAVVDAAARDLSSFHADAVVAVGGGSVIDAGKAISAAVFLKSSIANYLEGVGDQKPTGEKLPFLACPTTAGTGSEATKNAVLSVTAKDGFKKSLRHDNYVPDMVVIDPELATGCPRHVSAASGLDAITQLIESYVSTKATPVTDVLAESGLQAAGRSFLSVLRDGKDVGARGDMAYAAYLSGICLANAGLGVVHGGASTAGAMKPIPHGVFCGTLLTESVRMTIERLNNASSGTPALLKYAWAASLLEPGVEAGGAVDAFALVRVLKQFEQESRVERLSVYGFDDAAISELASGTGMKNHPVEFSREEICALLQSRL